MTESYHIGSLQIKEAYRALAKRHHPDLCEASARSEAERQFKLINEARTQLLASSSGELLRICEDAEEYVSQLACGLSCATFTLQPCNGILDPIPPPCPGAGSSSTRHYAGYQSAAHGSARSSEAQFSNGFVAAIISMPLILTGMWMSRTMPDTLSSTWRMNGLMQSPVNPWLREDLKPRTRSRWSGGGKEVEG